MKSVVHTRLFEDLIKALSHAKSSDQEELLKVSRREFLLKSAVTGATLMLPGFVWNTAAAVAKGSTAPRIVVIGAGLAGLTCAYRLKQAGYSAQIYEASNRIGGRCWTIKDHFDQGQIAEHGGELIDQGHTQIRQLAQELGLKLDNLEQAEANGTKVLSYFNESPYTFEQATNDLKEIWQQIHSDAVAAGYPTTYNRYTKRGWELDHMSITDWINLYVPGRGESNLGKLLDIAYNIEYGADSSEQSALNLIYLLAYSGQGQMRIFGPSNEKYHVHGGNDQIVNLLAHQLESQIQLNSELTAIKLKQDKTYQVTFKKGSGSVDVIADQVVIAIPFSKLKKVDYSKANFKPVKQIAIQELQMGTNTKLHIQFSERYWQKFTCNGETFSDTGYQNTWEVSRGQSGNSGILVNFTGGKVGADKQNWIDPSKAASQFLGQVQLLLPGIHDKVNSVAPTIDYWTGDPYTLGSYSYWRIGQYTKFAGVEAEREGNCHFAGEHTSLDFQGYLNGAVESGQRAANEILQDIKIMK
jgi:monoamine oxidase